MSAPTPIPAIASAWSGFAPPRGSILGLGVDLVEVETLARLVEAGGDAFLAEAWTPLEIADAEGDPERLAARWAAKEAAMKAMRSGIGELSPLDVELVTNTNGAPNLSLAGAALQIAQRLGIREWHVSLAHDGGWAVAIAGAAQ